MNDSDKLQAYVELFKAHVDKFNKTRDIQWKLNIALWTLMGAAGGFLYGKYTPSFLEGLIILAIFATGFFFFWAQPIQASLEQDKLLFSKYRNKLETLAGEQNPTPVSFGSSKFKWPLITSALTIFLFSLVLWILHSAKSSSSEAAANNAIQPTAPVASAPSASADGKR